VTRDRRANACPTRPTERVGRAIIALVLLGLAAAAAGTLPWLAAVLALAAAPVAFGAITGRCPIDFARHRRQARDTLDIAEARPRGQSVPARQSIDLGPKE
jgi:hypothetical protein